MQKDATILEYGRHILLQPELYSESYWEPYEEINKKIVEDIKNRSFKRATKRLASAIVGSVAVLSENKKISSMSVLSLCQFVDEKLSAVSGVDASEEETECAFHDLIDIFNNIGFWADALVKAAPFGEWDASDLKEWISYYSSLQKRIFFRKFKSILATGSQEASLQDFTKFIKELDKILTKDISDTVTKYQPEYTPRYEELPTFRLLKDLPLSEDQIDSLVCCIDTPRESAVCYKFDLDASNEELSEMSGPVTIFNFAEEAKVNVEYTIYVYISNLSKSGSSREDCIEKIKSICPTIKAMAEILERSKKISNVNKEKIEVVMNDIFICWDDVLNWMQ